MIPANQSGEYFGILDVCGKGATFIGTFLISGIIQLTSQEKMGLSVLILIFIGGLIFFNQSLKYRLAIEKSR